MNISKKPTRESVRAFYKKYENIRRGRLAFLYVDTYGVPEDIALEMLKKYPIEELNDEECDKEIEYIIKFSKEGCNRKLSKEDKKIFETIKEGINENIN